MYRYIVTCYFFLFNLFFPSLFFFVWLCYVVRVVVVICYVNKIFNLFLVMMKFIQLKYIFLNLHVTFLNTCVLYFIFLAISDNQCCQTKKVKPPIKNLNYFEKTVFGLQQLLKKSVSPHRKNISTAATDFPNFILEKLKKFFCCY